LGALSEEELARFRAENIGFVFQSFRLLPHLTALENVMVAAELKAKSFGQNNLAKHWLSRVGLEGRLNHLPSQLSGGEQQRVAVARAFSASPKLLFADEPTGNLDSKNGALVLELLQELQRETRSTMVVVTHDPAVAKMGRVELRLKDGVLQ
jgi:putative ABC transport system ATP-binding protein